MALEVRGFYTSEGSCPSHYTEGEDQEETLLCLPAERRPSCPFLWHWLGVRWGHLGKGRNK